MQEAGILVLQKLPDLGAIGLGEDSVAEGSLGEDLEFQAVLVLEGIG